MKVFKDAVREELVTRILSELLVDQNQYGWRSSQACWNKELRKGIVGNTNALRIEGELFDELFTELQPHLPGAKEVVMQLYVWGPLSGIAMHNDWFHAWGATLYLNKTWDPDYGGLFIWRDRESQELRVQLPEYATLVLNDNREYHMVTPVSTCAEDDRVTIQIWGK
ncbi:MAG: 2OG-Fe(II) oxygenase [Pseudomonadota bacterium]